MSRRYRMSRRGSRRSFHRGNRIHKRNRTVRGHVHRGGVRI